MKTENIIPIPAWQAYNRTPKQKAFGNYDVAIHQSQKFQ